MGYHSDVFTPDAPTIDLVEARRAMWLWAEPVIIDRAVEVYARLLDDTGTVAMARRHCRLWRNILADQPAAIAPIVAELHRAAGSLGLPETAVEQADDAILEELVDIVMCRYRSSRQTIKSFSLILMGATSSLGAARAA